MLCHWRGHAIEQNMNIILILRVYLLRSSTKPFWVKLCLKGVTAPAVRGILWKGDRIVTPLKGDIVNNVYGFLPAFCFSLVIFGLSTYVHPQCRVIIFLE